MHLTLRYTGVSQTGLNERTAVDQNKVLNVEISVYLHVTNNRDQRTVSTWIWDISIKYIMSKGFGWEQFCNPITKKD